MNRKLITSCILLMSAVCLQSRAQSPGGVTGPNLWLKSNAGISVADGATVATWVDQSGVRVNNATNSDELGSPVYRNNNTKWLNFNPSLEFDGTNSGLNYGNDYIFTPAANLGLSVFSAGSPDFTSSSKAAAFIFDFGFYAGAGYGIALSSHIARGYSAGTLGGATSGYAIPSPFASTALLDMEYTFGSNQKLSLNAKNVLTSSVTLAALDDAQIVQNATHNSGMGPVSIGRQSKSDSYSSDDTRAFDGLLGEVVLYGRSMTAVERLRVNSYLALKYGVTIDQSTAQDYLASDGTTKMWNATAAASGYNQNIFGIGRDDVSGLYQKVSKSANAKGIVTITRDNNFTLSNADAGRGNLLSDMQFLTIADSNSTVAPYFKDYGRVISNKHLLGNSWEVQNTGGAGSIYLQFDAEDADYNIPIPAGHTLYLVYDNSGSISAASTVVALTQSGNLWTTTSPITFSNKAKFTLATDFFPMPGGVGQPILWTKANAGTGTTTTGGDIATWVDQSGNAYDVAQGTIANRPTFLANSMNFNPSINYGTNKYFTRADVLGGSSSQFTILAVGQKDAPSTNGGFWRIGSGVGSHYPFSDNNAHFDLGGTGGGLRVSVNSALPARIPSIGVFLQNVTGPATQQMRINNRTRASDGSGATVTTSYVEIGAHGTTSRFSFLGQIPEFILFHTLRTDAEIQRVNSYLALKYGITLDQTTTQHYLASDASIFWNADTAGTFNHDIFGIGRDDASALLQKVSHSQNGDGLFVLSLDNDFTGANNDAGRTASFSTDTSFVVLSNNNGSVSFSPVGLGQYPGHSKTQRTWQMQKKGIIDSVFVAFHKDSLATVLPAGSDYYLLRSVDNNFVERAHFTYTPLAYNSTTGYYWLKIPVTQIQYITIAAVKKIVLMRHRKLFLFGDPLGYDSPE